MSRKTRKHVAISRKGKGIRKGGSRSKKRATTTSKPTIRKTVFGSRKKRNFAQKVFYYSFAFYWIWVASIYALWIAGVIKKNEKKKAKKIFIFFRTFFFAVASIFYWIAAIMIYVAIEVLLLPIIIGAMVAVLFYGIISLCRWTQSYVDQKVIGNRSRLNRRYKNKDMPSHFFKLIDVEPRVKERKR